MNADLHESAPPAHHIVAVVIGKLLLAGLGLAIGLAAGLFIGVSTGLVSFMC